MDFGQDDGRELICVRCRRGGVLGEDGVVVGDAGVEEWTRGRG